MHIFKSYLIGKGRFMGYTFINSHTTYTYNLCKCGIIGKSTLNLNWWYENIRQTKWINILQDKS